MFSVDDRVRVLPIYLEQSDDDNYVGEVGDVIQVYPTWVIVSLDGVGHHIAFRINELERI